MTDFRERAQRQSATRGPVARMGRNRRSTWKARTVNRQLPRDPAPPADPANNGASDPTPFQQYGAQPNSRSPSVEPPGGGPSTAPEPPTGSARWAGNGRSAGLGTAENLDRLLDAAPGENGTGTRALGSRETDPAGARSSATTTGGVGRSAAPRQGGAEPDIWDRRVAGALAFLRRRLTGEYEVDEFGFDRELTESVFQPLLRPLYRGWFRVEVLGTRNLPAQGPALVVANHSGTLAMDALILALAVHDEHPAHRFLRLLGADLVFRMPFISEVARKNGGTLACNADVERLLDTGELVGVFPEGFKGVGKHFRDRYKLQRFGRGGFVAAALRTGTPIVPAAIVGAEEIYPMLGNIKPLARLLGTPYFPVTPTFPWLGPLGLIPLPSKWLIAFGEPIEVHQHIDQADDPVLVYNIADQVRETIQHTLNRLLELRSAASPLR